MKALKNPEVVKGVLSFDFDGTLLCPGEEVPLDPVFFTKIEELRQQGWIWVINTGRSLLHMLEGFQDGKFPFAPDYLVAREREIYTPDELGRWHTIPEWHEKCAADHHVFFEEAQPFLKEVKQFIEEQTTAQWIEEEGDPAGIVSSTVEEMRDIVEWVDARKHVCPQMGYLRNTIYLRFSHKDYHKGSSLREIARLENVPTERVFAIGDGHNDMDKLHPSVAGMIACVGNTTDQEVRDHVVFHGGYVAQGIGSLGSVEALGYFI